MHGPLEGSAAGRLHYQIRHWQDADVIVFDLAQKGGDGFAFRCHFILYPYGRFQLEHRHSKRLG